MSDPNPMQMLLEGAQDAVEAFKLLRVRLAGEKAAIRLIDAHVGELEYAIAKANTPDDTILGDG